MRYLVLLLVLLKLVDRTQQQIRPFIGSCQDASIQGTIQVSIEEADRQIDLDQYPTRYRSGLRLRADPSTIGLQFDMVQQQARLDPNQYFLLEDGPRSDRLPGREWFLQLIRPLDRDGETPSPGDDINRDEYAMQCTDLLTRTTFFIELLVLIADVNDNAPQFLMAPYSVSVNELTPVGTTLFRGIKATDKDYGDNKNIVFSILSGDGTLSDGSNKFLIGGPMSGLITINQVLDFESLSASGNTNYILTIQASDSAPNPKDRKTTQTTLTITITDGDDLPPVFYYPSCRKNRGACFNPEYEANIMSGGSLGPLKTIPIPSSVLNMVKPIQAMDQDLSLNYPIVFSLVHTTPTGYEAYFALKTIPPPSGNLYTAELSLTRPVSRSDVSKLRVALKAQEVSGSERFNRAIIYINVIAANDHDPVVTSSTGELTGYIKEDAVRDFYVKDRNYKDALRLLVSDLDISPGEPPQQYTFSAVSPSTFVVDVDGFVRLSAASLDFETSRMYIFQCIVREASTPEKRSTTTTLTVSVLDINDNVPIFQSTQYDVQRPAGTYSVPDALVRVVATDKDWGKLGKITYSIGSVTNNQMSKFSIDKKGQVFLVGQVAEGESYVIVVDAADGGVPARRATAIVSLEISSSGNKAPVILAEQYTIYVSEGIKENQVVFKTPATDVENDPLSFSIVNSKNSWDNTFIVGRDEATAIVSLEISSSGNKAPVILAEQYTIYVSEGIKENQVVFKTPATDVENDPLSFSIVNSKNSWDNTFIVGRDDGKVLNRVKLDRETIAEYFLNITVADSSFLIDSTVLHIVVTDINDNSPVFTGPGLVGKKYTFSLKEGLTPPRVIGSVQVI
ncbi:cadherin-99C-like [Gigantopelta aegis]|uniref:cadherin-99C-like n=1 Tax=Gigantopelta aegis TaxID=1735272 RepID=UPI001B888647|nr:cadherin-99C-like [Gigantopelta aegis]